MRIMDIRELHNEFEKFHSLERLNQGRLSRLSSLVLIYKLSGVKIPLRLALSIKRLEHEKKFLDAKLLEIDALKERARNLELYGSESLIKETNSLRNSLKKIMEELNQESQAIKELEETLDSSLNFDEILDDIIQDDMNFTEVKNFVDDLSIDVETSDHRSPRKEESVEHVSPVTDSILVENETPVQVNLETTKTLHEQASLASSYFIIPGFESYPIINDVKLNVEFLPHINNQDEDKGKEGEISSLIHYGMSFLNQSHELKDVQGFLFSLVKNKAIVG